MKTYLQLIIGLILLCLSIENVYAFDNLSAQTNEFLVQKIDSFQYDKKNPEVWKYINAYILKAKVRKDNETLYYGFKEGVYYSNDYHTKLEYADSAIAVAQNIANNDFVIQGYLSKGMVHYQFKKFQPALHLFLLADKERTDKTSAYLSYKVLFNLALIKFELKQFSESDILFQKCSTFFEKNSSDVNHQVYYLNMLYYRSQILQAQQKFENSNQLIKQGLKLSQDLKNSYFIHYFTYLKAVNHYFEADYQQTISILRNELRFLQNQQDFNTLSKAYFYIGKSFESLNNNDKSIEYFKKIDELFSQYYFLDIDVRPAYETLIKLSIDKNESENQLYYINQLLKLDQLTQQNLVKLSSIIQKEYDEKELIKLKKSIEFKIRFYPILIGIVIIISSISVLYVYKHYFKSKFISKSKSTHQQSTDIPQEIVLDILKQLDEFETNQMFLQSNLTLAQLSKSFKTNSAYLSKIINTKKGTNFSNYINQLRVKYLLNLLTNSDEFHQHSISDLAELGGFTSSRHFSNAFYQVTLLRPNEYIKQLKNK